MSVGTQDLDKALFVRRGKPGEDRGLSGSSKQLLIRHLLDVRAEHEVFGRQAYIMAHLFAHEIVIAGENLDSDAMFLQCCNGRACAFLGGVQECYIAPQHEVSFIVF